MRRFDKKRHGSQIFMQLLGIHLEKNSLTLALIEKKKKIQVKFLETLVLEERGEAKELKQLLQWLLLKEKDFLIGSALETQSILLRSLEMSLKGHRALRKALPFQLESVIPYPLDEVIVIPSIEKGSFIKNKEHSIVTLFCLHEKLYLEHLEKYQSHGIDPQWISCVPQALYRFCKYYTEEKDFIVIHMSEHATHITAVLEDRPCNAFQIEIGKHTFLQALQDDFPLSEKKETEKLFYQIDSFRISAGSFIHFSKIIDRFLKELDRVFYFLLHKKEGRRLEKIFLAKEEGFLAQFKTYIEQSLDFSLQIIDSDEAIKKLKPYAIPVGLAIDVLSNDHKTLQFRKAGNTEKTLSQRILKKVGGYALSCLVCSLIAFFTSQLFLKSKEKTLDKQLSILMRRYPQEVAEVAVKGDVLSKLGQMEKNFSKAKKSYGYYLTPTTVSDFLQYLSREEKLCRKIEKITYELVQYPTLENPQEPYKIKVGLSMIADKGESLENFFEELFKNTEWIEETPKPLLTKDNDEYQATFFLKTLR